MNPLKNSLFQFTSCMFHSQDKFGRVAGRILGSAATSVLALAGAAGGVVLAGGDASAFTINFDRGTLSDASYNNQWNPPIDPAVPPNGPFPGLKAKPGPNPALYTLYPPYTRQWYDTNIQFTPVGQPAQNYFFPTDKQIWLVDKSTLTGNPSDLDKGGPSQGSGKIEWDWVDVSANGDWRIPPDPHSVDQWIVDVDFNPDLLQSDGTSQLDYVVRIANRSVEFRGIVPEPGPGNRWFEDVSLNSNFTPVGGASVTKEVFTAVFNPVLGDYQPGTLIGVLNNVGTLPLPPGYSILYIRDTATVAPGGILDSYLNSYRQVPAPLPLLGAGAALGFSRKLRGRIKSSRAA